jgi:hypothetical protein
MFVVLVYSCTFELLNIELLIAFLRTIMFNSKSQLIGFPDTVYSASLAFKINNSVESGICNKITGFKKDTF